MTSQDIKNIIASFEEAKKDYLWAYEQVGLLDKETQDILHNIELIQLTPSERGRLATRLRKVRILRRENKNIVEINEPVYLFLDSDNGRSMLNLLRELLGKIRKIEEYHRTRVYKMRTLYADNLKNSPKERLDV